MIWTTIEPDPGSVTRWIRQRQSAEMTPRAYELMPSHQLFDELTGRIAEIGVGPLRAIKFRERAGGMRVRFGASPGLADIGPDLFRQLAVAAVATDGRTPEMSLPDGDPDGDDDGQRPDAVGSLVTAEYWFPVDGFLPVGPGGRITYYRSARLVEIALHIRGAAVHGRWRDPQQVASEIFAAHGGEIREDERLQASFGYYEASSAVTQTFMRPVFVTLVDRRSRSDGPRWRLTSVHAATDIPEIPLTAGLFPAGDDSWRPQ